MFCRRHAGNFARALALCYVVWAQNRGRVSSRAAPRREDGNRMRGSTAAMGKGLGPHLPQSADAVSEKKFGGRVSRPKSQLWTHFSGIGNLSPLRSRALTATSRLEPDIASAAISGRSTRPKNGWKTPAAIGSAIAL